LWHFLYGVTDYFEVLQFSEPRLRLDVDDLQKRFYARSRELHPDRFARASAAEQQAALELSSVLNDAYRTLRDPLQRAEYVLAQNGIELNAKDVPPDLLEEVFELNMALEEADTAQLDAARARFAAMQQELDARLDRLFAAYDASRGRGELEAIRAQLNRRRYITNLIATASGEKIRH
jgi:molecular chaperone HscB